MTALDYMTARNGKKARITGRSRFEEAIWPASTRRKCLTIKSAPLPKQLKSSGAD